MQKEQEEELAKRWKQEAEEKAKQKEAERWRSVDEVMEEMVPKRKRIAAPPEVNGEEDIIELFEDRREESPIQRVAGVGHKKRRRAG